MVVRLRGHPARHAWRAAAAEVHVRERRDVDRREARLGNRRIRAGVREGDLLAARARQVEDSPQHVRAVALEAVHEAAARELAREDRRDAAVDVLPGLRVAGEALRERRVDAVPLARRAGRQLAADPLVRADDRRRLLVRDAAVERVGVRQRHLRPLVDAHVAHDRLVLRQPVPEVRAEPAQPVEPSADFLLALPEARGLLRPGGPFEQLGQVAARGRVAGVVAEHDAELRALRVDEQRAPAREDVRRRVVDLEVPGVDRVAALHETVLAREARGIAEAVVERADRGVELPLHPRVVRGRLPRVVEALDEQVLDVRLGRHAHDLQPAVDAGCVAERAVGGLEEARLLPAVEEVPDHAVRLLGLAEEVDEARALAVEVLHALHRVHVVAQPGHVVVEGLALPVEPADARGRAAVVRALERLAREAQQLLRLSAGVLDDGAGLQRERGAVEQLPARVEKAHGVRPGGPAGEETRAAARGEARVLAARAVEHGERPRRGDRQRDLLQRAHDGGRPLQQDADRGAWRGRGRPVGRERGSERQQDRREDRHDGAAHGGEPSGAALYAAVASGINRAAAAGGTAAGCRRRLAGGQRGGRFCITRCSVRKSVGFVR